MVRHGQLLRRFTHTFVVADLYIVLLDGILSNHPEAKHGREGFYFGENGEHTLHQIGKAVGETLVEFGLAKDPEPAPFTKEDIVKYLGVSSIF